ncbi:DUF368 domain-containing protein [Desulfosediminicola flagellatus]|uniref:DUF368 domain-containing protein n=1 Tax=Desulfosediminicola flagellatus TaxID=2569541 RepID=UPI0010AD09BD|nr:DUF368 domain-containing protein [Desulfosediminicola flagellatus]
MNWFKQFTIGFLIGIANLIPGVSGGTFALILGVYERLIIFLNEINSTHILTGIQRVFYWIKSGFSTQQGKELRKFLTDNDYPFMTVLGLGAIVCIVSLSSLMKYLLLYHFSYTYAFFFGLIILSVAIPWRMIKRWRILLTIPLLAGIFLTIFISYSVNPYEKSLSKSEMLEKQYQSQHASTLTNTPEKPQTTDKFAYIGKYTSGEYIYIFFCGIIAISAMVLPGVSGSLVLILMNQYFAVISALANIRSLLLDDLLFLGSMALGIVFGLLSFARFIEYAFKKFHDPMVSFLTGLILGSLYSLWPFKHPEIIAHYFVKEGNSIQRIDNYTVYTNVNIMPGDLRTASISVAIAIAGMVTMYFFLRQEKP